jgi:hypothetical protein
LPTWPSGASTSIWPTQQAGAVVTTFDGEPLAFTPDVNQRFYVVCSANRTLHQAVLDCLCDIRAQHNIEWRKVH